MERQVSHGKNRTVKEFFNIRYIALLLGMVVVDIAVYLILGVAMMRYDDFHDESEEGYLSLSSMDLTDKIIHLSFGLWNVINLFVLGLAIYKLIKRKKYRNQNNDNI